MKILFILLTFASFNTSAAEPLSETSASELKSFQPVHDCARKFAEAPSQASHKGTVVLDLHLDAQGSVTKVTQDNKKSTLHEDSLNSCLFPALKGLVFTKEANGKAKVVSASLKFPLP